MKRRFIMKNISKLLLSTMFLGALAASPVTTLAADGGVYHSDGTVEFVPNTDPTDPVDPTDPTNPVDPTDPTDPDGPEPGTNGPLSIDFASNLNFGKQKITSTDEVYHAAAQQFFNVDQDGNQTGDAQYGPDYVQVTDNRGTESGWTLTVTQDAQFKSATDHELDGASIKLKNANIQTVSASAKPTIAADTVLIPGTASDVMVAAAGQGAGTYLNDWGTKAGLTEVEEDGQKVHKTDSIELSVPGKSTKYAEKYSTKLTWTLSDVPGNTGETPAK